jgi:glycosyltransferase involved in cell wall biosynthesis
VATGLFSDGVRTGTAVAAAATQHVRATPGVAKGTGVSVLILTKNEEANIQGCLETLAFSDDIVVLDSHSTDQTAELAASFPNVRILTRDFDTEYMQRNHGLHAVEWKNQWVYVCDADERVPAELAAELQAIAARGAEVSAPVAYRSRYRNMFRNEWIRHCAGGDVWLLRMLRPEMVRYERRQTNVHPIVQGEIGELAERFVHYSFNSGLKRWFTKHNYYSDREAMEAVQVVMQGRPTIAQMRDADPIVSRRAMKNFSFFLPFRWAWRFGFDFVAKRGLLDGFAGAHYCALVSMYEYWIELKMKERTANWHAVNEAKVTQLLEGDYGAVPMMPATV